jgi:hypothetical protein
MNYSAHQLISISQISELRKKHGERFAAFERLLYQKLRDMPADLWTDYTQWVHTQNIPMAVKVICYYIECNQRLSDYYTFNKTFTAVKRTVDSSLKKYEAKQTQPQSHKK